METPGCYFTPCFVFLALTMAITLPLFHVEGRETNETQTLEKFNLLYNRSTGEMKAKRALFSAGLYDKTSRPVTNDYDKITVHIGISLYHILDANEKLQTVSLLIAVRLTWYDQILRWNPEEFGNASKLWLPSDMLWTPDIVINNNCDPDFKPETNAIVESTGKVLWMYPQLIRVYCTLDVRNFPFDMQWCNIKFFSWTYNGYQIDLNTTETENPSYFDESNQEWDVISIKGKRNSYVYACCPEPFPDISFTLVMKRRSMFYLFSLVFPCVQIYLVAFLGFFIPIGSNEKVNLEVTILLALVVFLMVIGETMPPSPDSIPILGMLYASTMIMVSLALIAGVAVTNVYYKEKDRKEVPRWLFELLYWRNPICSECGMPRFILPSALINRTTDTPFNSSEFVTTPLQNGFISNSQNGDVSHLARRNHVRTPQIRPSVSNFSKSPNIIRDAATLKRVIPKDNVEHTEFNSLTTAFLHNLNNRNSSPDKKRLKPSDSPSWKKRTNDEKDETDVWVPLDNTNGHLQEHTPKKEIVYFRQLSDCAGQISGSRLVTTDAGCIHKTITWHEIAESIDSILFWIFLSCSLILFTALFLSVDFEGKPPNK